MDKATFKVEIESPHGKRAIENWRHWIGKVSQEANERWGIQIDVSRIDDGTEHSAEFQTAADHDQ